MNFNMLDKKEYVRGKFANIFSPSRLMVIADVAASHKDPNIPALLPVLRLVMNAILDGDTEALSHILDLEKVRKTNELASRLAARRSKGDADSDTEHQPLAQSKDDPKSKDSNNMVNLLDELITLDESIHVDDAPAFPITDADAAVNEGDSTKPSNELLRKLMSLGRNRSRTKDEKNEE